MKMARKIICLVMSVIMLFTGTPILQAGDLALNLDKAQMAEFQQEILQDVNKNINKPKDPVKELIDRYNQALANYEARAKDVNEQNTEAVEARIKEIEREAEIEMTDEKYDNIKRKEKKQVAFNSVLYRKLDNMSSTDRDVVIGQLLIVTSVSAAVAFLGIAMIGAETIFSNPMLGFRIAQIGKVLSIAGGVVALIALAVAASIYTYTPKISPSATSEETLKIFSEKPFAYLAEFHTNGEGDFGLIYKKCPQILTDTIDIEYYTSLKFKFEDEKDKIFTKTIDWRKSITPEKRADYLHQFAERLRSEAREGTKEQFRNLKVGLEEA